MHELAQFLGHLHPLWVHLPIGIFLLLALLELSNLLSLAPALSWLPSLNGRMRSLILAVGAASAAVAALLGWLLARGGDYGTPLVGRHEQLGIAAAVAALVLLAVHRIRRLYIPAFLATLAVLVAAGHAGAKITHGSDYLTAHMPRSLGRLLGVAPKVVPPPRVVTAETAIAFQDVVQPILQDRCVSCHGASKSNGGLRLDSFALLAKGGKHGPELKPGSLAASELIRRINLPADEKEHMPPRGKPQLSDDDITLLEWWVGAGAPESRRVASLEASPSAETVLEARLGGGAPPPDRAATLAAAARIAPSLGILIRSISPDGPWLDVNARVAGKAFGDRELAQLAPVAGAVQWLDIGGTAVTDAGLASLEPMAALQRLHLDGLKVGDAGLARISRLRRIAYLNLRGTAVTDKGLESLRGLPRLRSLYVWQTAVTPAAVQALGEAIVDRRRVARWEADESELGREIAADHFDGNTGETLRLGAKPTADAGNPPPTK